MFEGYATSSRVFFPRGDAKMMVRNRLRDGKFIQCVGESHSLTPGRLSPSGLVQALGALLIHVNGHLAGLSQRLLVWCQDALVGIWEDDALGDLLSILASEEEKLLDVCFVVLPLVSRETYLASLRLGVGLVVDGDDVSAGGNDVLACCEEWMILARLD